MSRSDPASDPTSARSSAPSQDAAAVRRPLATFRLTRSVALQWLVVSAAGFFGFAYCFGRVLARLRGVPLEPIVVSASSPPTILAWSVVSLGLLACVVVPHELLHGLFLTRYGGAPRYGVDVSHFVLPYAYAETSGTAFTRNQLLAALLAPFVGITAVGLAAMAVVPSPVLIVPLAANAAGSIGDLWMAAVLLQYPADVRVGELPDGGQGFGIYGATDRAVRRLPGTPILARFLAGGVATFAAIVTYALLAILVSLAFASGDVVLGDPDRGWLLVRHVRRPGGTAALEIGDHALLGLSALGGLAWSAVATVHRRLASGEEREP
ncbi:DUF3267 domain-containing protein [Natrinema salifodinae]|uniref:Putative zincin peptidase n=1 Tax=Natrinema salifodinae TaxID=1202768 RepID=A0A1I0NGD2_9EURY|nr:DUF3267 domain-containing protein [Natrinema salifodinae]SEW00515.1 Putative zincin peptidase [Natrinema salifodinae]